MHRDDAEAARRKVKKLIEDGPDKRIRVWARFRLGGEPLCELARELNYTDGSGVHQVVRRLEAKV